MQFLTVYALGAMFVYAYFDTPRRTVLAILWPIMAAVSIAFSLFVFFVMFSMIRKRE